MNRIDLLTICIVIFACSFVYASDDPNFSERIRANGIVTNAESILLSSNVYFYPNKKGYGLLSGSNKRFKGYIVFTENNFAVVSWSRKEKVYEVLHQEAYSDLESSDVTGNAPFLRLVTESKTTGKFSSYEIIDGRNAITPDVVKTKEAHKLIIAGIKGYDVKGAATVSDLSSVEIVDQKRRIEELEARIARLEQSQNTSVNNSDCDCKCPKN